jgi:hypothetical protein
MDWTSKRAFERNFLRKRRIDAQHKIARLQHALAACDDCLEAESLERMLHAAQLEHDLIDDLLLEQQPADALSLDALIMTQLDIYNQQTRRLSHGWRRGRRTPAAYWEATSKQAVLNDLLRRYHAYHGGRPYYADRQRKPSAISRNRDGATDQPKPLPDPTHFADTHTHPWYIPAPGTGPNHQPEDEQRDGLTLPELDTLRERVYTVLDEAECTARYDNLEEHIEVIVQPDGMALLTGYVHSQDDLECVLERVDALDRVSQVVADLKVVRPANCPACHPERFQAEQPEKDDP